MTKYENLLCKPEGQPRGRYDITVDHGLIKKIDVSLKKGESHLSNLAFIPRGVDVQAHLRVPGQPHKETAATGLEAAYYGGYAALLTMPNTLPVIDSVEVLNKAKESVQTESKRYDVEVYFTTAITEGQLGKKLAPLEELAKHNIKGFTDDGRGVMSDELMEQAFKVCETTGIPLLQHAEMEGHGGALAPGPVQKNLKINSYPESAEVDMVKRDLTLLEKYKQARYHVLHISAAKTAQLVEQAKNKGLQATCEVSPHHLFFNSEQINPNNSSFKMNPPLRSREDQTALFKGLITGQIDFVATDHAPHEEQAKHSDFHSSANGTIGLETTLPVLTHYYQQNLLSLERLLEVWSTKPAEFLNIKKVDPLSEGKAFKGLFVDLESAPRPWSAHHFHSLSKNSCFIDSMLPFPIVAIANQNGIKNCEC